MKENNKPTPLTRFGDILAWFFLVYPFPYLLSTRFIPGPLNIWEVIATGGMFLMIPSVIWLHLRYKSAPRNTYPLADKFYSNAWFRVLIALGGPIVFYLLIELTTLIRPF